LSTINSLATDIQSSKNQEEESSFTSSEVANKIVELYKLMFSLHGHQYKRSASLRYSTTSTKRGDDPKNKQELFMKQVESLQAMLSKKTERQGHLTNFSILSEISPPITSFTKGVPQTPLSMIIQFISSNFILSPNDGNQSGRGQNREFMNIREIEIIKKGDSQIRNTSDAMVLYITEQVGESPLMNNMVTKIPIALTCYESMLNDESIQDMKFIDLFLEKLNLDKTSLAKVMAEYNLKEAKECLSVDFLINHFTDLSSEHKDAIISTLAFFFKYYFAATNKTIPISSSTIHTSLVAHMTNYHPLEYIPFLPKVLYQRVFPSILKATPDLDVEHLEKDEEMVTKVISQFYRLKKSSKLCSRYGNNNIGESRGAVSESEVMDYLIQEPKDLEDLKASQMNPINMFAKENSWYQKSKLDMMRSFHQTQIESNRGESIGNSLHCYQSVVLGRKISFHNPTHMFDSNWKILNTHSPQDICDESFENEEDEETTTSTPSKIFPYSSSPKSFFDSFHHVIQQT